MISLRVFIATLALAVKLDSVRAAYTRTSPVTFYYKSDYPYDYISVNIILTNVPAEADSYTIYYQTGYCGRSITTGQHSPAGCDVPARHDTIPTNRTITIVQKLGKESLRIYIVLRNKDKICATKWIMDGVWGRDAYENPFRTDCLNKYRNLCDITVDFGNQCEELRAKIYCSQNPRLTCEVVDEELPEDTVNRWYQQYKDGTFIGNIPPVKGKKTEFKMTIHKFDSNTYIFNEMSSTHWGKDNLLTEILKIPLPTKVYENVVEHVKKYTANEQVSFNCSNSEHTQTGWIEPTGNKIITYNKTITAFSAFNKTDNNSMLCCLNYHTYHVGSKTVVERKVTDITVLIYEESVYQDNNGSTSDPPLSTTSRVPKEQDTQDTRANSTSPSDSAGQHSTDPHSKYYIALAAAAGIVLLASLTYVVIKKCCRKSSDPEQTLQLETYATTNMVLYAELDIRPGTAPAPASTEEATYAEIIGVLRPENGHVKK